MKEKNLGQPIRICSNQEMRELDLRAEREFGIEARILMENAGRAATQVLLERYPEAGRDTEVLVFAGKGNNAGDAFAVARRLICLERKVRLFHLVPKSAYRGSTLQNFEILERLKAKMVLIESVQELESFFRSSRGPFTLVDGILGTGLKGQLEGLYSDVIEFLNEQEFSETIALDIPTGVDGDTGEIRGTSIRANLTVSFGFPKLGHFLPPGAAVRGELINVDISLPPKFRREGQQYLLRRGPLVKLLKLRDRYGHKNSFGHTLLIGGSPGRMGAIVMAARACHRMGTGLVTVASWKEMLPTLWAKLPDETMSVPIEMDATEERYAQVLKQYSSIVIGPGLGMRAEGKRVIETVLTQYAGPVLIDADGLNLLAEHQMFDLVLRRRAPTVFTPHPGEMARLMRREKRDVMSSPLAMIRQLIEGTQAVVVLKGAATFIGSAEGPVYLSHYPNDGMATAGSGDVLAGMVGGLLGQGVPAFEAAQLGVVLHSVAGESAADRRGHRSMTAPDIIEGIGHAFQELKSSAEVEAGTDSGRARLL